LKAFSRETLAPGEIRQVTLEIPVKSLQYWDEKLQSWNDDLCNIELQVGASAGNVLVKKEVTLK
jgi:beta-glucosidase